MPPLFALGIGDPMTLLILGALAVMLFGERLPEVAQSFGKRLMELKSGVREIQNEIESAINSAGSTTSSQRHSKPENREEATAPKFEPPPGP